MSHLPVYIERPDIPCIPTPATITGATMYFIPVRSSVVAQQHMLDKLINGPSHGVCDYRSFFPQVFFMFACYDALRSDNYPGAGKGYWSYEEAGLWVPTIGVTEKGGATVGNCFAMFAPYMWVNDAHALIAGRELQGWPKIWAYMDVPIDPKGVEKLEVRPKIVRRYGPNEKWQVEPLISFKRRPGSQSSLAKEAWTEVGAAVKGITNFLFNDGVSINLPGAGMLFDVATMAVAGMDFVFLKQFRDGTRPDFACYQSGQTAHLSPLKYTGGGVLDGVYDLDLIKAASNPLRREFGMNDFDFQGLQGFYIQADVHMDNSTELWCNTK